MINAYRIILSEIVIRLFKKKRTTFDIVGFTLFSKSKFIYRLVLRKTANRTFYKTNNNYKK